MHKEKDIRQILLRKRIAPRCLKDWEANRKNIYKRQLYFKACHFWDENNDTLSITFLQHSTSESQNILIFSCSLPARRIVNGVIGYTGNGLLSRLLYFCLRKELCQGQANMFLLHTGNSSSWCAELNINNGVHLSFSLQTHQYQAPGVYDQRSFTLTDINQLWLTHPWKLKVWIFNITQYFPIH